MDILQRNLYGEKFSNAFARKKGSEFQDWFISIVNHFYGTRFQRVRPTGKNGDYKCDGYVTLEQIVFQCYAPSEYTERKLNTKITEDFSGAKEHWKGQIKKWVFVHNVIPGLGPTTTQLLNRLREENPDITIETWCESELRDIAMELKLHQLEAIFGFVPSMRTLDTLSYEDIAPVIAAIQTQEPYPLGSPIKPVSVEKLDKNQLPLEAAELLKIGRRKEQLVRQYFSQHNQPDFGEHVAQAFREKYGALKAIKAEPGTIFNRMHEFAGGIQDDVKKQGAVLAILSYFFENCDIFEDPD
jgi:hypothetical protein